MDNKQDIGAAFKQQLADLNEGPRDSAALWDQIATQLDAEGNKPKGVPFWFKSGLAILIVGVTTFGIWKFIYAPNISATPNTQPEVTELQDAPSEQQTDPIRFNLKTASDRAPAAASKNQSDGAQHTLPAVTEARVSSVSNPNTTNKTVSTTRERNRSKTALPQQAIGQTDRESTAVNLSPGVSSNISNNITTVTGSIPEVNTNTQTTSNNRPSGAATFETNTSSSSGISTPRATARVSVPSPNKSTSTPPLERAYSTTVKSTVRAAGITLADPDAEFGITTSGVATPLAPIPYNDKKAKKTKALKAAERAIRRKELTNYRWSVGAVIAPTTYGSLTRASMLDARLEGNPREGETNLSYGLQIKNQVNEKSALRFGVNRVKLGYNTQNFQVNIIDNVVNIYQLTGIDPGAEIEEGGIPLDPGATAFFESNEVVTIDQDISYLEIPVEYQYAVVNNRFGANLIGGASLMVLDDNRIFAVNNNGESLRVGKSNNLTNLGYTLNFGLGFKYEITKHIQLNLDPMFKIQMNKPENTTVNNFRPYYFGVFSGLHFKF